MKTEIDPKIAWGIIVVAVVLVIAIYYFFFRTPSGEISAKEAGAGPPVRPGEPPPGSPPLEELLSPAQPSQPTPSNPQ